MISHIVLLIVSLLVLAVGAELLVAGAVALASRSRVSPLFIGVTVIGFGTSTPELCTSLLAALRGLDDIAVGNVVGSNTFNIAMILGITALICPIAVTASVVRRETWIIIAVAVIPLLALLTGGSLGRVTGVLMLTALALYLRRLFRAGVADGVRDQTPDGPAPPPAVRPEVRSRPLRVSIAMVVGGIGALVLGSFFLIDSASPLAAALGLSDLAIGLTVVAAGTSAPELITSVVAAVRRQPDLAVGNVYGSNVFNMLGILGLTCLMKPQVVPPQVIGLDTPVMLLASLAMLPIVTSANRISRVEGLLLCLGYIAYVVVLLAWAPKWFGAG